MFRNIATTVMLFVLYIVTVSFNLYHMEVQKFKKSLNELTDGLLYSSESDYPFEILDWGKKTPAEIRSIVDKSNPGSGPAESMASTDFFNKTIRILEMSGDGVMMKDAERYKELQSFLLADSGNVTVWRSGKIQVGIYIVIVHKEGDVFVLKTTSIET